MCYCNSRVNLYKVLCLKSNVTKCYPPLCNDGCNSEQCVEVSISLYLWWKISGSGFIKFGLFYHYKLKKNIIHHTIWLDLDTQLKNPDPHRVCPVWRSGPRHKWWSLAVVFDFNWNIIISQPAYLRAFCNCQLVKGKDSTVFSFPNQKIDEICFFLLQYHWWHASNGSLGREAFPFFQAGF